MTKFFVENFIFCAVDTKKTPALIRSNEVESNYELSNIDFFKITNQAFAFATRVIINASGN